MTKLRTFAVTLETRSTFAGTVRARSESEAVARARRRWTTQTNPFEEIDEQLVALTVDEVRS